VILKKLALFVLAIRMAKVLIKFGKAPKTQLFEVLQCHRKLILSVDHSANLAVIHTPPGAAQFLASSLDHAGLTGVIGTIAGDDTIILVSKKATGGAHLAKELLAYAQGDGKKK
jgi:arginine repressor